MTVQGRKVAVLIGNMNFKDGGLHDLSCPENDVQQLKTTLEDADTCNFSDVVTLINQKSSEILEVTHKLLNTLTKNDTLLIYYSGHGKTSGRTGELYLATNNTDLEILETTAIAISNLQNIAQNSRSNKIILILDCCYSGAAGKSLTKGCLDDNFQSLEGTGTVLITASTGIQVALEGENGLSVLTDYIIQGLSTGDADKDKDGYVSVSDLYSYVHEQIKKNYNQEPTFWNKDTRGKIRIAKSNVQLRPDRAKRISLFLSKLYNEHQLNSEVYLDCIRILAIDENTLQGNEKEIDMLISNLFVDQIKIPDFLFRWKELSEPQPKANEFNKTDNFPPDIITAVPPLSAGNSIVKPEKKRNSVMGKIIKKLYWFFPVLNVEFFLTDYIWFNGNMLIPLMLVSFYFSMSNKTPLKLLYFMPLTIFTLELSYNFKIGGGFSIYLLSFLAIITFHYFANIQRFIYSKYGLATALLILLLLPISLYAEHPFTDVLGLNIYVSIASIFFVIIGALSMQTKPAFWHRLIFFLCLSSLPFIYALYPALEHYSFFGDFEIGLNNYQYDLNLIVWSLISIWFARVYVQINHSKVVVSTLIAALTCMYLQATQGQILYRAAEPINEYLEVLKDDSNKSSIDKNQSTVNNAIELIKITGYRSSEKVLSSQFSIVFTMIAFAIWGARLNQFNKKEALKCLGYITFLYLIPVYGTRLWLDNSEGFWVFLLYEIEYLFILSNIIIAYFFHYIAKKTLRFDNEMNAEK